MVTVPSVTCRPGSAPRAFTDAERGAGLWLQASGLSFPPGMPFNQLGTLAGSKHYSVEAMYCYLRW